MKRMLSKNLQDRPSSYELKDLIESIIRKFIRKLLILNSNELD